MKEQKTKSFTESLKRLDEILERLQDPECELEESLELLEEGLKLHKECKDKLEQTEARIQKIIKSNSPVKSGLQGNSPE
jgi:exodeoxyribonuclease VII small subunit